MNDGDREVLDLERLTMTALFGFGRLLKSWAKSNGPGPFRTRLLECIALEHARREAMFHGRPWEPSSAAGSPAPGRYLLPESMTDAELYDAGQFFDQLARPLAMAADRFEPEELAALRELAEFFRPWSERFEQAALEHAAETGLLDDLLGELFCPRN